MSGARERMLTVWDDYLAAWLGSPHAPMPPSLARWKDSYHGTGEGAVCDEAMPEPFIGDWFGARLVTLGLNPGAADLPFQARGGHFAKQRVADTGFRHW